MEYEIDRSWNGSCLSVDRERECDRHPPPAQAPLTVWVKLKSGAPGVPGNAYAQGFLSTPSAQLGLSDLQNSINRPRHDLPGLVTGPGRTPLALHDPEREARRWLSLQFEPMNAAQSEALVRRLRNSPWFESVEIATDARVQLLAPTLDELSNYNTVDAHKHQYALTHLNVPNALGITLGRALLAAIDGGVKAAHLDLDSNLRLQHVAVNDSGADQNHVGYLDDLSAMNTGVTAGHGTHVIGIMAAELNSTGATPTTGSGTVGMCPKCGVGTIRTGRPSHTVGDLHYLRSSGATAVNMSFQLEGDIDANLATLNNRDVAVVAAAGNSGYRTVDYPAGAPTVYAIGATDEVAKPWLELNYVQPSWPAYRRHPQVGSTKVTQRCTGAGTGIPGSGEQCGTNLGAKIAFMAPGVRVLSTLDRVYTPLPNLLGPCPDGDNAQKCHLPPASNNMGSNGTLSSNSTVGTYVSNLGLPSTFNQYGTITGTSMAAPHITGLVGLLRSANPLLASIGGQGGDELGNALAFGAAAVSDPICTAGGSNICGAGIPNAEAALKRVMGTVNGVVLNNRLTPMFELATDGAAVVENDTKKAGQPINSSTSWLYTSSPQVAMAGISGDLYYTDDLSGIRDFGTYHQQIYKAAYTPASGTNHVVADSQYRHRLWGAGAGTAQLPWAPFYVFSTENAPAGTTLVPLYRMAQKCFTIRKHYYTISDSDRNSLMGFASRPFASGCPTVDTADIGYFYEGVEGYIFSPTLDQPAGTVALYRGRKIDGANSSWAIFTSVDQTTRFSAFSDQVQLLGYVYPTVNWNGSQASLQDQDFDGLSDAFEITAGLNEQAANGDCDGVTDATEFPMAGISTSDPMGSNACADLRVSKTTGAGIATLTAAHPIGPSNASSVTVEIDIPASTPDIAAPFLQSVPSGWTCPLDKPDRPNKYICTRTSGVWSVGSSAQFVINQQNYSIGQVRIFATTPDPETANNFVN
jgi:subtilisin family serine protease